MFAADIIMDAAINAIAEGMPAGYRGTARDAMNMLRANAARQRRAQSKAMKIKKRKQFVNEETQTRECPPANMSAIQKAGHTSHRSLPATSAFGKASLGIDDMLSMVFKQTHTRVNDLFTSMVDTEYIPGQRRVPSRSLDPITGKMPFQAFLLNTRPYIKPRVWTNPDVIGSAWSVNNSKMSCTATAIKDDRLDDTNDMYKADYSYLKWIKVKMLFCGVKKVPAKYRAIVFRPKGSEGDLTDTAFMPLMMPMFLEDYRNGTTHPCSVTRNLAHENHQLAMDSIEILADRHITCEPEETMVNYDGETTDVENRANHVEEIFIPVYKMLEYLGDVQHGEDRNAVSTTTFNDDRQYQREGDFALPQGYAIQYYPLQHTERIYVAVYSYQNDNLGVTEGYEEQGFDISIERAWALRKGYQDNTAADELYRMEDYVPPP